jgi:hypothetical protein
MRAIMAGWGRMGALCAALILAVSLAAAPAVDAVTHGPGALASQADDVHGHGHETPAGQIDVADHDPIGMALPAAAGVAGHPPPARLLQPDARAAEGTIRDGPRRPPRLTAT